MGMTPVFSGGISFGRKKSTITYSMSSDFETETKPESGLEKLVINAFPEAE